MYRLCLYILNKKILSIYILFHLFGILLRTLLFIGYQSCVYKIFVTKAVYKKLIIVSNNFIHIIIKNNSVHNYFYIYMDKSINFFYNTDNYFYYTECE